MIQFIVLPLFISLAFLPQSHLDSQKMKEGNIALVEDQIFTGGWHLDSYTPKSITYRSYKGADSRCPIIDLEASLLPDRSQFQSFNIIWNDTTFNIPISYLENIFFPMLQTMQISCSLTTTKNATSPIVHIDLLHKNSWEEPVYNERGQINAYHTKISLMENGELTITTVP